MFLLHWISPDLLHFYCVEHFALFIQVEEYKSDVFVVDGDFLEVRQNLLQRVLQHPGIFSRFHAQKEVLD